MLFTSTVLICSTHLFLCHFDTFVPLALFDEHVEAFEHVHVEHLHANRMKVK